MLPAFLYRRIHMHKPGVARISLYRGRWPRATWTMHVQPEGDSTCRVVTGWRDIEKLAGLARCETADQIRAALGRLNSAIG